jgi:hypothetical protein
MIFFSFLIFILFSLAIFPQENSSFKLQEGDLIFQDLDCGPLCDAIEKVTAGYNGSKFSHIGLVVPDSTGELVILEAISSGVQLTLVDKFLERSFDKNGNPKAVVGRLKINFRILIPGLVKEAKSYLGKPYDNIYVINNDSYYCSELIYLSSKKANNGYPLFELYPMTFKDPEMSNFYPAWVDYYKNLNEKIPEGEPGINPGGISLSDKIEIVHIYGYPDGWNQKP